MIAVAATFVVQLVSYSNPGMLLFAFWLRLKLFDSIQGDADCNELSRVKQNLCWEVEKGGGGLFIVLFVLDFFLVVFNPPIVESSQMPLPICLFLYLGLERKLVKKVKERKKERTKRAWRTYLHSGRCGAHLGWDKPP